MLDIEKEARRDIALQQTRSNLVEAVENFRTTDSERLALAVEALDNFDEEHPTIY